jgi:hypothetical protein
MPLFGPPNIEKMKQKGDINGLIKVLGYQDDPGIRLGAVNALGNVNDYRAVQPLLLACKDKDEKVRVAAIEALGQMSDERAVSQLIHGLESDDQKVRVAVRTSLSRIGEPAVGPLISALKNAKFGADDAAIHALVRIGASAIPALLEALKDSDRRVSLHATEVLNKLGWHPASDELGAIYFITSGKWEECESIGMAAVEPLLRDLKNHPVEAMITLGKISTWLDDPALRARLIESLIPYLQDRLPKIAQTAASELERLGWQPVTDELGARFYFFLGDWKKCADYGSPAVPLLVEVLKEPERKVARKAAEILLEIYNSGHLDSTARQQILDQKKVIEQPHQDGHTDEKTYPSRECYEIGPDHEDGHVDRGIALSFPL